MPSPPSPHPLGPTRIPVLVISLTPGISPPRSLARDHQAIAMAEGPVVISGFTTCATDIQDVVHIGERVTASGRCACTIRMPSAWVTR